MANPTTKAELATYVKQRLGHPVISINVSDAQIDDRIDDAVALFQDYHYAGTIKTYYRTQLTTSNMSFTLASTGTFSNGETFVGATSNVTGKVYSQYQANAISFVYNSKPITNTFTVGETITGSQSGATATINAISLGYWDNEYISTANDISSVIGIVEPSGGGMRGESSSGLFSGIFPVIANDILSMGRGGSGGELLSFQLSKMNMEMLHDLLVGDIPVRFNRHSNQIFMDIDWSTRFQPLNYVLFSVVKTLDPNTYSDIWGDRFVRDYATALIKKQWGQNLLKFEGIQMPGGVMLNGKAIYEEGNREAEALESSIQLKYELPPSFIVC